ncbi:MAG: hypothetical protein HC778_04310 [Chamaesiphon sp. CSU_1_12]|nr:hypothetical protein [Chamaesiphon sp. CSU_1_12]
MGQPSSPGAVTYNPPLKDLTAFAVKVDPKTGFPFVKDADGKLFPPPPEGPWYPTYWNFSVPDVVYPAFIAGSYCMYCHGSAVSESTFSSLDNLLGKELEFDYLRQIPPAPAPTPTTDDDHERVLSEPFKLLRSSVKESKLTHTLDRHRVTRLIELADLERRVASQLIGTNASVSIGETRSIRVFVLGEAYRPGSYTVSGLSTITNADKIVVIHDGRIIEQGTHAELLANQRMYYELYKTGFQE